MPHRVKLTGTARRGKLAFPTRASWVKHVKISGGVVSRVPEGRPDAGKLAARYGGPGTRYLGMAPVWDVAPVNIRALDEAAKRSDTFDRVLDAPREFIMHDYAPALDKVAKEAFHEAAAAAKQATDVLPPWLLPLVGAIAVAYVANTFGLAPRRR